MKYLAVLLVTFCAAYAAVIWKDECAPGYFQCSNGLCIPDVLVCDGVFDCVSGVDEANCTSVNASAKADVPMNECSEGSFTCNNGLCIPEDFVCDGVYNCISGNDEADCGDSGTRWWLTSQSSHTPRHISPPQTHTPTPVTTSQLSWETVPPVTDVPMNECSEGSFTCNNGLCIPEDFVCDGVYNCISGNDEADCGE